MTHLGCHARGSTRYLLSYPFFFDQSEYSRGAIDAEEWNDVIDTQIEIMRSAELQRRTDAWANAFYPDFPAVLVGISVAQKPKTTIFGLTAISGEARYNRLCLDNLMGGYIAFRKEKCSETFDATLTSLREEFVGSMKI